MSDQHGPTVAAPAGLDPLADVGIEPPEQLEPLAAHAPVKPDSPAFSAFDVKPEIIEALPRWASSAPLRSRR